MASGVMDLMHGVLVWLAFLLCIVGTRQTVLRRRVTLPECPCTQTTLAECGMQTAGAAWGQRGRGGRAGGHKPAPPSGLVPALYPQARDVCPEWAQPKDS